ncbi:TRAM domain-containing protein [Halorarius litoreus]|uniref:TRAM domain-containing protein n=1 Tax=Halorarius litoreus TaxID=2962676 RepID=UPI0020CBB7D1|nr:hypothetical protein [Halorarius litoreus]
MEHLPLLAGVSLGIVVLLVGAAVLSQRSGAADESRRAHEAAQEREPPVDIGETHTFGITEFTDHHSGAQVAVGKVEGFVLFTEDVPDGLEEGDVIRAKVLSFNQGHTSADAAFVERV